MPTHDRTLRTRMGSRRASRLVLLVCSAVLSLLCAEAALHWLEERQDLDAHEDLELGWASDEYARFDPGALRRVPGRQRILFLGDSMIAERGRMEKNRIPSRLQEMLGSQAIVRTLATAGWGTDQELLAFLRKGRHFAPDVVLLAFCAYNDLGNILSNRLTPKRRRFVKPYFALEQGELVLRDRRGLRISEPGEYAAWSLPFHSKVLERLVRGMRALRAEAADDPELRRVDPRYRIFKRVERPYREVTELRPRLSWSPQATVDHLSAFILEDFALNAYQWRLLEAIIAELEERTDAIGSRLVLVLLPAALPTFGGDLRFVTGSGFRFVFETPEGPFTLHMSEPRDRLAGIARRHEIELFDPTREFLDIVRTRDIAASSWMPGDNHFAGPSHKILAGLLRDHLQRTRPR